ncbi:MAG TPA: hypothetical protein VMF50_04765 [Candidatus Binataceae bacterium]|nr:hypothetical protein [Candidatus Binataceae bacterium]
MTIRSWARAGVFALASALVCGWASAPAIAGGTPPAESEVAPVGATYSLALRGNLADVAIATEGCNFCNGNSGNCSCLTFSSGSSSYWSWGNKPYSVIGFTAELDYFPTTYSTIDNGTGGNCSSAIGEITVQGSSSPNAVYAETVGMLCDAGANTPDPSSPYTGATYTGSYLIEGDQGVYDDAAGSGALSFGLNQSPFQTVPTAGQLQMTGNITPNTGVSQCSAAGEHC